jgi:hypothetical protein
MGGGQGRHGPWDGRLHPQGHGASRTVRGPGIRMGPWGPQMGPWGAMGPMGPVGPMGPEAQEEMRQYHLSMLMAQADMLEQQLEFIQSQMRRYLESLGE